MKKQYIRPISIHEIWFEKLMDGAKPNLNETSGIGQFINIVVGKGGNQFKF